MRRLRVPVRRTGSRGEPLPLPKYMSEGASGLDLRADVESDLVLAPLARARVPTGFSLAIPPGWEGQVRPRSGLALDHGVTCLNAPGTVDSDYRGELCVVLANLSDRPYTVRRGDRIAQLVLCPVGRAAWVEVGELPPSTRAGGGFGSTG